MIVDRYDPINLFEMVPKLNLQFEPELTRLDELLDVEVLFCGVKADLSSGGLPTPADAGGIPRPWRCS